MCITRRVLCFQLPMLPVHYDTIWGSDQQQRSLVSRPVLLKVKLSENFCTHPNGLIFGTSGDLRSDSAKSFNFTQNGYPCASCNPNQLGIMCCVVSKEQGRLYFWHTVILFPHKPQWHDNVTWFGGIFYQQINCAKFYSLPLRGFNFAEIGRNWTVPTGRRRHC